METFLWILQIALALAFLGAGGIKLAKSRSELVQDPKMSWAEEFSEAQIKGIGALEIAGAIGLIIPAALDVAPILTPIAAAGLALTMAAAAALHVRRNEMQALAPPVVLGLLALLVAIFRFGPNSL